MGFFSDLKRYFKRENDELNGLFACPECGELQHSKAGVSYHQKVWCEANPKASRRKRRVIM